MNNDIGCLLMVESDTTAESSRMKTGRVEGAISVVPLNELTHKVLLLVVELVVVELADVKVELVLVVLVVDVVVELVMVVLVVDVVVVVLVVVVVICGIGTTSYLHRSLLRSKVVSTGR